MAGYVCRNGKTWWAQYYANGQRVRVSTGVPVTAPKADAKNGSSPESVRTPGVMRVLR